METVEQPTPQPYDASDEEGYYLYAGDTPVYYVSANTDAFGE